MDTITIPKTEYRRLRKYSNVYLKIIKEISDAPEIYPYDYDYIERLVARARKEHREGKSIRADSVDQALAKFKKR